MASSVSRTAGLTRTCVRDRAEAVLVRAGASLERRVDELVQRGHCRVAFHRPSLHGRRRLAHGPRQRLNRRAPPPAVRCRSVRCVGCGGRRILAPAWPPSCRSGIRMRTRRSSGSSPPPETPTRAPASSNATSPRPDARAALPPHERAAGGHRAGRVRRARERGRPLRSHARHALQHLRRTDHPRGDPPPPPGPDMAAARAARAPGCRVVHRARRRGAGSRARPQPFRRRARRRNPA